jgi:HEAT repeat protein
MMQASQDDDPGNRLAALRWLQRYASPAAVPRFLYALTSGTPEERLLAAEALHGLPGERSTLPLISALSASDEKLRTAAGRALCRVADQAPSPDLRAAVPLLKSRLRGWRLVDREEHRVYRAALWYITEALKAYPDLPIPSTRPAVDPDRLPRPGSQQLPGKNPR